MYSPPSLPFPFLSFFFEGGGLELKFISCYTARD